MDANGGDDGREMKRVKRKVKKVMRDEKDVMYSDVEVGEGERNDGREGTNVSVNREGERNDGREGTNVSVNREGGCKAKPSPPTDIQRQPKSERSRPKRLLTTDSDSPVVIDLVTQLQTVVDTLSDARQFRANYRNLINTLIPNINATCSSYVKDSKESIVADVFTTVVDTIDWNDLRNHLIDDMKSRSTTFTIGEWTPLESLSEYTITEYDVDSIINMFTTCTPETVKQYASYMRESIANVHELLDEVTTFEQRLCEYRTRMVKMVLERNVQILYRIHFNHVFESVKLKTPSAKVVTINGVKVDMKQSQKEFVTNALKTLLRRHRG